VTDEAPSAELQADRDRLAAAFVLSGLFASLLWLIMIAEVVTGADLTVFGVHPGTLAGLAGILTAPFIHGSEAHLFANTLPIVILGTALLYGYPRSARIVVPALFLLSGLGVWLFGRESYHIGASGLTVGMMFFVFGIGVLRWDRRAIGLALIVFFLYGGMVWSVLPGDPQVSYESHLSGAVIGVVLAVLLRKLDPPPAAKRYSWEVQPNEPVEDEVPWALRVESDGLDTPGSLRKPFVGLAPGDAAGGMLHEALPSERGAFNMDVDALRGTLSHPAPPEGLSPALRGLWHLGRKEWDAAHVVVQDADDADSAWVHAHLHRVEGDLDNARYWYRRARRPEASGSLDAEWEEIVTALSAAR
jgi:membrane associated rhomboid family serine protease